jgi:hypothetical protein
MKHATFAFAVVTLVGCAAGARAQQPLQLEIAGGRVTLHARNMPVRAILTEWARLGGATIVNGDRVGGSPLTLDLENVPERQALDIVLRGVSGYMLAARDSGAAGASMYDRIMIIPTSVAPRNPAPASPTQVFSNGPAGIVRPLGPRVPGEREAEDDQGAAGDADGVPIPRPVPIQRTLPTPVGAPVAPLPLRIPEDGPAAAPPPAVVVTPANPFGVPPGSSAMPGVVTPAPQPQNQNQQPRPGVAN